MAFIGADGTGKTTLVDHLARELDVPVKKIYLGQKRFVIPLIDQWGEDNGKLRSAIFRWIAYPIDLRLRTAKLSVRQWMRKEHSIVLVDRLPAFPFQGGSRILRKIYRLALPRVDVLVLLTGDAELIFSRKPEGSKGDVFRNLKKSELLFINIDAKARVRLDISRTVAQHVTDLTSHIASFNETVAKVQ